MQWVGVGFLTCAPFLLALVQGDFVLCDGGEPNYWGCFIVSGQNAIKPHGESPLH